MPSKKKSPIRKFATSARKGLKSWVDKVVAASDEDTDDDDDLDNESSPLINDIESQKPFLPTAHTRAEQLYKADQYQNTIKPPLPPRSFLPPPPSYDDEEYNDIPSALRPKSSSSSSSSSRPITYGSIQKPTPYTPITSTSTLQSQISHTTESASEVVGKLLTRGQNLNSLLSTSDKLTGATALFKRRGRTVERQEWFSAHKTKLSVWLCGALAALIFFGLLIMLFAFLFRS